jgi:hypothetical protein
MKRLLLVLADGNYYFFLILSAVAPGFIGAFTIEIYTTIFIGMLTMTFYRPMSIKLRCAITAQLLVIFSIHIPIAIQNQEEAKNVFFGYPFAFITRDCTEMVQMTLIENGKFPIKTSLCGYIKQTDYWAMLCSTFLVFLALITGWIILKKIAHHLHR